MELQLALLLAYCTCENLTEAIILSQVEITIEPTCVSTDMSRSMSYANYETPRACVSETNDFNETIIDDPLQADDCRNTRCQVSGICFNSIA